MTTVSRILLLPGFGEDERIFRALIPHLEGYKVEVVDYRPLVAHYTVDNIALGDFIKRLIMEYRITGSDVLIGHSMGGFFAHHIRQLTGSPNCLHASFINPDKVRHVFRNIFWLKTTVLNGFFTSAVFREAAKFRYSGTPSYPDIAVILEVLASYPSADVFKFLSLMFKKPKGGQLFQWLRPNHTLLMPCLWIHPKDDLVVSRPDEAHLLVAGDHFALGSRVSASARLINQWLASPALFAEVGTPAAVGLWRKAG